MMIFVFGVVTGLCLAGCWMIDTYRVQRWYYRETQLTRIADKLEKIERKLP